jgi:hypothetical protein
VGGAGAVLHAAERGGAMSRGTRERRECRVVFLLPACGKIRPRRVAAYVGA